MHFYKHNYSLFLNQFFKAIFRYKNYVSDTSDTANSFIWSNAAVYLLLEIYREKQNEFSQNKRHNKIWAEIATEIKLKNSFFNVIGIQCATKIPGLKRIYKNIKDQNKKSGNCRSSWALFSVLVYLFKYKL